MRNSNRAQTSMEYLLIISASVLIILSVILIGQGYIGQTSNLAGNQLVVYHVLLNRLDATPAPVPPFPCAESCGSDADCSPCQVGYAWKCTRPNPPDPGYCEYAG